MLLVLLNIWIWQPVVDYLGRNENLAVTMLDVGQGDAILLKTPEGRYGLVDGGRGNIVLAQLAKVLPPHVHNLEFVVLTHPDADHIEGIIPLLQRYKVSYLFANKSGKDSPVWESLLKEVDGLRVSNFTPRDNNDFLWGCCTLVDVVWPPAEMDTYHETEANDISIGLAIHYYDFDMFLAGDLGGELEMQAVKSSQKKLANIEVLKAGHHGSKTSSSLTVVQTLMPAVTLISVGAENPYGHPHAEVLENLTGIGSQVFRTDQEGSVKISTDGKSYFAVESEIGVEKFEIKH